jgi:AcrR family transcriptional regulator
MKVRTPKHKKGIQTKQKIMKAAIQKFSKKGYYKTNTKEIAAQAGVPIGSFYAYFKNKKDVLYASIVYYNKLVADKIINFQDNINFTKISLKDILKDLIENAIDAHKVLPDFHNEITFLIRFDPKIKANMDRHLQSTIQKTIETLNKVKDKIRIKNIEISALLINRIVEDFIHFIIYNKPVVDISLLMEEFVDMLYQYIKKS